MNVQGKHSTEFLMTLAVFGLALANGTAFVDIPWEHFKWLVGGQASYVLGRSAFKTMAFREGAKAVKAGQGSG